MRQSKKCVRFAGPECEIKNCKKGVFLSSNSGGGHNAAHNAALKAKHQNLFQQNQQKSRADLLLSRQKHQLGEISEIDHLNSEFLTLKTEFADVKEQNKRYVKKLSEHITYSTQRSASL